MFLSGAGFLFVFFFVCLFRGGVNKIQVLLRDVSVTILVSTENFRVFLRS